jgi:hypothetical protein
MIRGDSSDYELLSKWTKGFDCQGYKSCEIGVREGLGSKIIMDNVVNNYIHVGVDPYGNLKYQHYDNTGEYTCAEHRFSKFAFVHFDGPHMTKDVITEAVWFATRTAPITRFVFDDYTKYEMPLIETILKKYDFNNIEQGKNKILLEKK